MTAIPNPDDFVRAHYRAMPMREMAKALIAVVALLVVYLMFRQPRAAPAGWVPTATATHEEWRATRVTLGATSIANGQATIAAGAASGTPYLIPTATWIARYQGWATATAEAKQGGR